MSKMTEAEAVELTHALVSAMVQNDKESREMLYADLTNDELKKVLRWMIRQFISVFGMLCAATDQNPSEAWQNYCKLHMMSKNNALPDEIKNQIKDAAETIIGTEITAEDFDKMLKGEIGISEDKIDEFSFDNVTEIIEEITDTDNDKDNND